MTAPTLPTVGRILWYYDYAGEPVAALVTGTYPMHPWLLDLVIFPRGEPPRVVVQSRAGAAMGCWAWPPR